jgi:hypothetical protein
MKPSAFLRQTPVIAFGVMFTDDKNGWIAWCPWCIVGTIFESFYRSVDTAAFSSETPILANTFVLRDEMSGNAN